MRREKSGTNFPCYGFILADVVIHGYKQMDLRDLG
jgi:hypothetical protein